MWPRELSAVPRPTSPADRLLLASAQDANSTPVEGTLPHPCHTPAHFAKSSWLKMVPSVFRVLLQSHSLPYPAAPGSTRCVPHRSSKLPAAHRFRPRSGYSAETTSTQGHHLTRSSRRPPPPRVTHSRAASPNLLSTEFVTLTRQSFFQQLLNISVC